MHPLSYASKNKPTPNVKHVPPPMQASKMPSHVRFGETAHENINGNFIVCAYLTKVFLHKSYFNYKPWILSWCAVQPVAFWVLVDLGGFIIHIFIFLDSDIK